MKAIVLLLVIFLPLFAQTVTLTDGIEIRKETLDGAAYRCFDAKSFGNLAIKLKDGKTCRQQEVIYKENQALCDSLSADTDTLQVLCNTRLAKKDTIITSLELNLLRKDTVSSIKDSIILNREAVIMECESALDAQGLLSLENIMMAIGAAAVGFLLGMQF